MMHRKDDEHFSAHVTVAVSPQFFGWLAGLGRGIKIRYPEDVKEQYRAYLQGIVDDPSPASHSSMRSRRRGRKTYFLILSGYIS